MNIKDQLPNCTFLDPIGTSGYVFDANKQKIGWYNYETNLLCVEETYPHIEPLIEKLQGIRILVVEAETIEKSLYG
jgi:hypothetical protein